MTTSFLTVLLLCFAVCVFAQPVVSSKDANGRMVYTYRETYPEFRGSVKSYLQKNLKYPEEAKQLGVEGRVVLKFRINTKGRIDSISVKEPVHPSLDSEAVRVVKLMPRWQPARRVDADGIIGKAVNSYVVLPISFKLEEEDSERASAGD